MQRKKLLGLLVMLLISPAIVRAQWEPDFKLSTTDSAAHLNENMARCIVACADTLHVIWCDTQNHGSAVFYKRSADQGETWGPDTRLSGSPGYADFPSLALSGSSLHLVWRDNRSGQYTSYYKRSLDGGRNWGPDVSLGLEHWWPGVAAVGPYVYVALNDNLDSTNSEVFFRRSTDNGTTWDSIFRISNATGRSEDPCIEAGDSLVHIAWNEFRDGNCEVYYRRSSDRGVTWGPETRLTNAPLHSYSPNLVASGPILDVAWEDRRSGNYDIYRKRSTDFGLTWGPDIQLTSDTANSLYPTFVLSGSNIHMLWFGFGTGAGVSYLRSTNNGATWDPIYTLVPAATSPGNPFIAYSGPALHVVWVDRRDGHTAIYYKRNLTGNVFVDDATRSHADLITYGIFPNPFIYFATIPDHECDMFEIYDISGRNAGVCRGDRIGAGLAPGVYFLKSGSAKPIRFVKIRK